MYAAARYYSDYIEGDRNFVLKEVLKKIAAKEIATGKPVIFKDEKLTCENGQYVIEAPEDYRMGIRVHLQDGNSILTEINGTHRSVSNYYLGKYFEGSEAIKVEFLS